MSTPTIDAPPALEVISFELPDEPTMCVGRRSGAPCGLVARWWAEHECGAMLYACDEHRAWQERKVASGLTGRCKARCGQTWTPVLWHSL